VPAEPLEAPFGVQQFIQNVQLSCPDLAPSKQIAWAKESLDDRTHDRVQDQMITRDSRMTTLQDLRDILIQLFPSTDEQFRLFEPMFQILLRRPATVSGFYAWSDKMLRCFAQAKTGGFPVPSAMSLSLLLLGLATIPGAVTPLWQFLFWHHRPTRLC
jgi:hypothetical protein